MGSSRGGLTRKIHALVEGQGHPVKCRLIGGQVASACLTLFQGPDIVILNPDDLSLERVANTGNTGANKW